jgi:hypothetical protein
VKETGKRAGKRTGKRTALVDAYRHTHYFHTANKTAKNAARMAESTMRATVNCRAHTVVVVVVVGGGHGLKGNSLPTKLCAKSRLYC